MICACTAALTLFGTWHYGVPAKTLYMLYDHFLGTAPTLMNSIYKMLIDVYLHGPLLVIPSFYLITFAMRGQPLRSTMTQLKKEWWEAAFGSVLFWTPIQLCMFLFIPQHCKVAYVAAFSFIHKTWLSWLSNREAARALKPQTTEPVPALVPADALPAPQLPLVRQRARSQPIVGLPFELGRQPWRQPLRERERPHAKACSILMLCKYYARRSLLYTFGVDCVLRTFSRSGEALWDGVVLGPVHLSDPADLCIES